MKEPKKRRMTNQEFAWWLREKSNREYKRVYSISIHFEHIYSEQYADEPVSRDFLIRENGGEWHEPLVGVEE